MTFEPLNIWSLNISQCSLTGTEVILQLRLNNTHFTLSLCIHCVCSTKSRSSDKMIYSQIMYGFSVGHEEEKHVTVCILS